MQGFYSMLDAHTPAPILLEIFLLFSYVQSKMEIDKGIFEEVEYANWLAVLEGVNITISEIWV